MRGTIYSSNTKGKVKQLILDGSSYREITQATGVPKSTISTWFGKTVRKPWSKSTQREHLASIRKIAAVRLKNKWEQKHKEEFESIHAKVQQELLSYPRKNLGFYKAMLAMLYWAEGSKYYKVSRTEFTNTDPRLAHLYITLLRKCYTIDESKFAVFLRVHHYHSISDRKKFWSELLGIPQSQFLKVSIKPRSKTKRFRKNFAGICSIRYKDTVVGKELMEVGYSLQKILEKELTADIPKIQVPIA